MTAEIAILNKSAVALAADSAVTISAGSKEEKIFDSADKLFELSDRNPVGVMIYNGMSFMEAPLPSLIRQFRRDCTDVGRVEEAADAFLDFLSEFGRAAPTKVKDDVLRSIVAPLVASIFQRFMTKFQKRLLEGETVPDDVKQLGAELLDESIDVHDRVLHNRGDALFRGGDAPMQFGPDREALLRSIVDEHLQSADEVQKTRVTEMAKLALRKDLLSQGRTGIVVAGFGSGDLFPTLISFEIDGMVCDRLRYIRTNYVDIDRQGTKARVLPFAQKEMVERFLYGLDESIQGQVTQFCKETVPTIRSQIFEQIQQGAPEQREALLRIMSGEDTEPGATIFQVFSATFETVHEPVFADIQFDMDVDGRTATLTVPGMIDARGEPIRNPVTGQPHQARIDLPQGFEYARAEVGRGWATTSGAIKLSINDAHAHFAGLHMTQSGVVH